MIFHRVVAPGLELRQFAMSDAGELYAAVDRNRAYLREWLPWVDKTLSPDHARDFIASKLEQAEGNRGPTAAIRLDGAIVGAVGCHPIDWLNRHASIGYWLDEALQGKGLMTRAAAAMIDHLFADLDLHRVVIQCGTGNLKSCAIPERLGFTREGAMREAEWVNDRYVDLVVWGILHPEWIRFHAR